jgi:hypothetical protein
MTRTAACPRVAGPGHCLPPQLSGPRRLHPENGRGAPFWYLRRTPHSFRNRRCFKWKKWHPASVLICSLFHQHAAGKNECLKCDVIFCVGNEDAAFAQGCALSRAFPLYTRKGGVSQTPGDLAICASFWNTSTSSGMDDARLLREITATAQVRRSIRAWLWSIGSLPGNRGSF